MTPQKGQKEAGASESKENPRVGQSSSPPSQKTLPSFQQILEGSPAQELEVVGGGYSAPHAFCWN